MSAPNTNEEKDKPAHKTPIYGMVGVVVFALVLLFALITWLSYEGNNPQEDDPVVDGIYKGVPEPGNPPQSGIESDTAPQSGVD